MEPCAWNSKYALCKIPPKRQAGKKPGEPDWVYDVEVKLRLSAASAKKLGRELAEAKAVYGKQDIRDGIPTTRWDLCVAVAHDGSKECYHSRLVGFSFLKYGGRKWPR